MQLVYVGMHEEVEVDGLDFVVTKGEPIEVPETLAGQAPVGHRADVDEDGNSLFDPGFGLLAQPDNWQPYEAPSQAQETAKQRQAREKAEADAAAQAAADAAAEQAAAAAAAGTTNTEGQAQQ